MWVVFQGVCQLWVGLDFGDIGELGYLGKVVVFGGVVVADRFFVIRRHVQIVCLFVALERYIINFRIVIKNNSRGWILPFFLKLSLVLSQCLFLDLFDPIIDF